MRYVRSLIKCVEFTGTIQRSYMGTLFAKLGCLSFCVGLVSACGRPADVSSHESKLGANPWFVPWIRGQPWVDQRSNFAPPPPPNPPRSYLVGHAAPLAISDRNFALL